MELVVFVLLAMTGVGVQSACTSDELQSVYSCLSNYNDLFISQFGRSGSCNRALITPTFCGYYNNIVSCANGKPLSDTQCRPYIIGQMNTYLVIPCKIEDFQAACPYSGIINYCLTHPGVSCNITISYSGSEHLQGSESLLFLISWSLLFGQRLSSAF